MFINFSNHPSLRWSIEQREAAERFGLICDIPFPAVNPAAGKEEIRELGDRAVSAIIERLDFNQRNCVMCSGEFSLTFYVVKRLREQGIITVAATTERVTVENTNADGSVEKRSEFRFVQFREYV